MTVHKLSLKTLSPLHIGDGDELKQDFDFVTHGSFTYRINEDALLMTKESLLHRDARTGRYPVPGKLLTAADFNNAGLFRYILRGTPRSAKTDARVRSFIKDVYDRPYIPGSSLKGALRTALAWTGWKEINPSLNDIGPRKAWAGQGIEHKLFGANPNLDLLRALHVSDLFGPHKAGGNLALVNAQVLTKKTAGSPVELEAIPGDVSFTGSLTIDDALFSPLAEPILRFANRKHWLDELMKRTQAHSLARIHDLVEWFEQADHTQAIAGFYRKLAAASLPANQALVQIGWGAGWDAKTFWTHLQTDPLRFERLVTDFRLHKAGRNSPPRKTGDAFPRSKRAAMLIKDDVPEAVAPFGWVLMELSPE
jgi:CRISPR-associated protein Csm5